MDIVQQAPPALRNVVICHIFAGLLLFIIDTANILSATSKLHTFQQHEDKEEEEDQELKKKTSNATMDIKEEGDVDLEPGQDDLDEEEEVRPIAQSDRLLLGGSLLIHMLYTCDILYITSWTTLNSGTVLAAICFVVLLLIWGGYAVMRRKMKEATESWLLYYRLATIVHLVSWCITFWVCFAILLLDQQRVGFFEAVYNLNPLSRALTGLILATLVAIFIVYAVILFVHSRSMWALDEIASLHLAAQLQLKLKAYSS